MNSLTKTIALMVAVLCNLNGNAATIESGVETDMVHNVSDGSARSTVLTLRQDVSWLLNNDGTSGWHLKYRLWVDGNRSKTTSRIGHDNIEKVIFYYDQAFESLRLRAGLQEITWGENTLMPILDVVNQRDINHPRGYYDVTSKIPQGMIIADWQSADLSTEAIFIPFPTTLRQPSSVEGFDVDQTEQDRFAHSPEYGLRLGYRTNNIDSHLYYFRGWSRIAAYQFKAFSDQSDLQFVDQRSEIYGVSTSHASDAWITRGDLAHQTNVPATNIGTHIERSGLTQAILGGTWTEDSTNSVSAELHADRWQRHVAAFDEGAWVSASEDSQIRSWIALSSNMSFDNDKFESFVLAMRGFQNNDRLIRCIGKMNATDHLVLGIEYQRSHGTSRSPKILLGDTQTISIRTDYSF